MWVALIMAFGAEIIEEIKTIRRFLAVLLGSTVFGAVLNIIISLVVDGTIAAPVSVTMVDLLKANLAGAFFGVVGAKIVRWISTVVR